VGRYALRAARTRARRWQIERNRGELSDFVLLRALGDTPPEVAFAHFAERFFVDPAEARRRARSIASSYPEHASRTLAAAEDAVDHVFDLLGSGRVRLGRRIDWQQDFTSGVTWPLDVLGDEQDNLRLGQPCDVKVPWELSRCHHFVTLGRAYALEPDPRYAREFADQLVAWLEDNPWPYGINWCRAMEVAVRAVNWTWAAALFASAPEFTPELKFRFLKAILQHGEHVLNNLEFADNNGNHYLSNGTGLLLLGLWFPDLVPSARWRRKGREIVWGEMARQVYPDGVDFEQGIGYQGLVAEFWYTCVLQSERVGQPVPPLVRDRLERMFDFMLAYTRPDGTFPQIGDTDDGRLAALDDEPVGSHRRHLAVGGAMFSRPDLLAAAADAVDTAIWLCGPDLLNAPRVADQVASRAFPAGGFYVMRDPDSVLVIDAGEVGMRGIGGHGHADVLSFDLWTAGADVLVDSGTYAYSADVDARQTMRATAAHNALRVDGQDSSRLGGDRWLWLIENDAQPYGLAWSSGADHDIFVGSHTGFRRLPEPVDYTRRIVFDKLRGIWRVEDQLDGRGEHLVELFFHPGVPFDLCREGAVLHAPRADVWLFPPEGTRLRQDQGWISRGYGLRESARVLVYAVQARVPIRLRTDLLRVPRGTPSDVARSLLIPGHC
jgi:hypothetical protein